MKGNEDILGEIHLMSDVVERCTVLGAQRIEASLEIYLPDIVRNAYDHRGERHRIDERVLPQVISEWRTRKKAQEEKNKVFGHLFNPLNSIPIGETTHSRILGDLLDPHGSHGQGSVLLERFLKSIDVPFPERGEWRVSIEVGHVDICLWRADPVSVVIIENKSNWALDRRNQLYRYWYENIYRPYSKICLLPENKDTFQLLYLTPVDGRRPARHSLERPENLKGLDLPENLEKARNSKEARVTLKILGFREEIALWLDGCIKSVSKKNRRLRIFLQFYKELWS